MQRFFCSMLVVFLISIFIIPQTLTAADTVKHIKHDKIVDHAAMEEHHSHNQNVNNHGDDHANHSDMSPLYFVILALIIGAATRHFLRKSPIPYTVMLLLLGATSGYCR
jgi:ABC-type nickel/cobalt efflux system permease component RcnA